jgi:hypothetical protein
MIECISCLKLPICINKIKFRKDDMGLFPYGFYMSWDKIKCEYFSIHWGNDFIYIEIKEFFLKKQGLMS